MSSDGVDGRDDLSVSDIGEFILVAEKIAVYRKALSPSSCMLCARTRFRVGVNGNDQDVGMRAAVKSLDMLSICRVGDCCDCLRSVHAGGVHEMCGNPETILSSLLMLTRLDWLGSSCCLMRIAHRSSCVHRRPLLCQSAVRPHTSCCLVTCIPDSSPVHNHCSFSAVQKKSTGGPVANPQWARCRFFFWALRPGTRHAPIPIGWGVDRNTSTQQWSAQSQNQWLHHAARLVRRQPCSNRSKAH